MHPRKNSHLLRNWVILLVVLVVVFFGAKFYLNFLKSPVNSGGQMEAFVVQRGEGSGTIADRLEEEGFIRSANFFKLHLKLSGSVGAIEAGDFKLSSSMTMDEVIKTLSEGSVDKWVTLLEGWRVEEMAKKLNSDLGINSEEFLRNAKEGYMFPDTYLFNPESNPADIASTMRNTFDKRYDDDLQNKIRAKGLTPEQGVIMASLVEREARSDKVRTQVASIILKRFKLGMKLDIDATVQYAKDSQTLRQGEIEKFWKPITRAEYSSVVSSYNTYLNNGLPPAPICNPSLSSLNAVANADASTPYLFYYHDSAGNSHYARTIEEHNENFANNR